jgi:hypothetical protein
LYGAEDAMKQPMPVSATVAYTPRHCRPELFGSCQVRQELLRHAAA